MATNFNIPCETSMGFVVKVNDNDVWMDVKNISLSEGASRLFKPQKVHYLMILNMTSGHKILLNKEFQEFLTKEAKVSRAFLFKLLKVFLEYGIVSKEPKRGWYKLNGLRLKKRKITDEAN